MKRLKGLMAALAILIAAVPCAATAAYANSADIYEERYNAYGVLVAGGQPSVLQVESEKLYFDINTFPVYDKEEEYDATVTAEYKFVNPTGETVKTKMGFPLGNIPGYFSDMSHFTPHVYSGEEELPVQKRHTLGRWNSDFKKQAAKLQDGFYEDAFYNKDLTVTPYKFKSGGDAEELKEQWEEKHVLFVEYNADLTLDKSKTRYISASSTDSARVMFNDASEEQFVYVLGEDNFQTLEFTPSVTYGGKERLADDFDLQLVIEKQEQTTLKELLLKSRKEESDISEADWFNGIISLFTLPSVSPYTTYGLQYVDESEFLVWYVYDFELAPHASAVNKVTSPIFPSYSGNLYYYNYYLSPAKNWASFGSLEVVIRTDFSLGYTHLENLSDFERVTGGYRQYFEALPEGELEFSLYGQENAIFEMGDNYNPFPLFGVILVIIVLCSGALSLAGAIFGLVYLIKHKR